MTYLKLKNNRLRISLTKHETEQLFGSSDNINKNDPKTSLTLKMLYKKAASDNNLNPDATNVWIEVARNLSGGYDIYFTKDGYCSVLPKASALIFEFISCDAVIKASRAAAHLSHNFSFCQLYRYFNRYRMVAASKNGISFLPAMFEFAESMQTSRIEMAKTLEYGHLLIKENAIEVLSKL